MGEQIILNQDNREVVRGAAKDSLITVVKVSAPDVYVNAIDPKDTTTLRNVGDSAPFPKMTRMRLHIFRILPGNDPFSAKLDISPIPDSPPKPLSNDLLANLSLPATAIDKKKAPRKRASRTPK
jgi:hypothetical protein